MKCVIHLLNLTYKESAIVANGALALINLFEPAMIGPFMLTTQENHQRINGFKEGTIIGEYLDYAIRSVKDDAHHHMHLRYYVLNSTKRVEREGRLRFTRKWAEAFFYVRKNGPIYDNFEYYYGDYIQQPK